MSFRRAARDVDAVALAAITPDRGVVRGVGSFLSTVVQGGLGWAVTSAGLVAAGGRYRRAGLHGMVAWAAAEVVAFTLKGLTSRRRPSHPVGASRTRSSSMPSSHTAAGVAYAVGAGSQVPLLGLPVGATAFAVGWSRLSTRRHFPTDVTAGAFLGAAVGAAVVRRLSRLSF